MNGPTTAPAPNTSSREWVSRLGASTGRCPWIGHPRQLSPTGIERLWGCEGNEVRLPDQSMPSNSTSKTSVAFGGMAPG